MDDKEYFSRLYKISKYLNKEYSLHSALRITLEKTVEVLNLETGWIWLVEENAKPVYRSTGITLYGIPAAKIDLRQPRRILL